MNLSDYFSLEAPAILEPSDFTTRPSSLFEEPSFASFRKKMEETYPGWTEYRRESVEKEQAFLAADPAHRDLHDCIDWSKGGWEIPPRDRPEQWSSEELEEKIHYAFDADQYLANYGDLQRFLEKHPQEDNGAWAKKHYIKHGYKEGRSYQDPEQRRLRKAYDEKLGEYRRQNPMSCENPFLSSLELDLDLSGSLVFFITDEEAEQYIANYPDLQRAAPAQGKVKWAKRHYSKYGHKEHRTYQKR